jgi:hypothetical protein
VASPDAAECGEGDSMVELGFVLLGLAFSIAVAQVFVVPRTERLL